MNKLTHLIYLSTLILLLIISYNNKKTRAVSENLSNSLTLNILDKDLALGKSRKLSGEREDFIQQEVKVIKDLMDTVKVQEAAINLQSQRIKTMEEALDKYSDWQRASFRPKI